MRLVTQLDALRKSAARLAVPAQCDDVRLAAGGSLDRAALEGLVELLLLQRLSAMGRFVSISSRLRGMLTESAYEVVRDHMNNLRFGDAANALEASQR